MAVLYIDLRMSLRPCGLGLLVFIAQTFMLELFIVKVDSPNRGHKEMTPSGENASHTH